MQKMNARWAEQVMTWEYSSAAAPNIPPLSVQFFPASLHESGKTRVIPLDLSEEIKTSYPATTPNLLANYIRINPNDALQTSAHASSQVFYVMRGAGRTESPFGIIEWQAGDAFTLPFNDMAVHYGDADSALYWVHDAPMFSYIGGMPMTARFQPAYYSRAFMAQEIERIREAGIREQRNRNGIILGNLASEETKTITHTMWSLYNLLPAGALQKPHRHNSVALDLVVSAGPNTYTMIGKDIDEEGNLLNPLKAVWEPNSVFVTPPGWWHSHHNESDQDAYVFPVQDAGLHIYMRTLDIRFAK